MKKMKKIILILVIVFTFQFNAKAKEVLGDVSYLNGKVVTNNGHNSYSYKTVNQTHGVNSNGETTLNVSCKDPGDMPCQVVFSDGHKQTVHVMKQHFDYELIYNEYNKMLSSVEDLVINGKLTGSLTSKIQIYSIDDNKPYIVCLEVVWSFDENATGTTILYADILS